MGFIANFKAKRAAKRAKADHCQWWRSLFLVPKLEKSMVEMPFLMGCEGGYLPDTRNPEVWAQVVIEFANLR
jgi:hypothetical protein